MLNLIDRGAGVLLHPTSLYGNFGIGDFGSACFEFIDFLSNAKQKFWQILPLNPVDNTNSPYQSCSAFAGNDLLISPEVLLEKKYIAEDDLKNRPDFDLRKINYQQVREFKSNLFLIAYENFKKDKNAQTRFLDFNKKNKSWLDDYALFLALKKYFLDKRQNKNSSDKKFEQGILKDYYEGGVWNTWPEEILMHEKKAINKYQKELADEINYYKFLQFEFFEQWMAVKKYANEKNIEIIGDLPIFTAYNSCDVWANKNLFKLDQNNYYLPKFIAGVPPDDFSADGQLWGNPVYDWEENKNQDYKWWLSRVKHVFKMVDIVRIDHFRGFESYWEVAFGAKNAINGKWIKGPGKDFFDFIEKKLG
ncbi:MAG: 4-alpha-glucanotransferase, partial [Firmicutes bacterium]|nr:4-alpha-glucanotransferase [Bacillota bacterium]